MSEFTKESTNKQTGEIPKKSPFKRSKVAIDKTQQSLSTQYSLQQVPSFLSEPKCRDEKKEEGVTLVSEATHKEINSQIVSLLSHLLGVEARLVELKGCVLCVKGE